jgi:long-chain acyl-CoA synthetase
MNIADHIQRGAREYPNRPALIFEGKEFSYRYCDELSSRAAAVFADAGVAAGDRVALFLRNMPEFCIAYLGALKLGAIAVSINANVKHDDVMSILSDCSPKVAITMPELSELIPGRAVTRLFLTGEDFDRALEAHPPIAAARQMLPDDAAVVVYTSGTTDSPKGVTLSHANVIRNIEAKQRYLGIRPDDRGLLFLPLYHCFGQNAVFNAMLHAGATVVLHRRFDLERVMRSVATDGVTMLFGVPATFVLLLSEATKEALSGIRLHFSAAAPLSIETELDWAKKFGASIFQGYGLSETSPFASYNHIDRYRPGSIGTPIDGVEIRIVDPLTGQEMAAGEEGEIAIRGHNVMLGYWNRPADTARVIRDGWLHSGDLGAVDCDGYLFIRDRLDDMIISGGVNIYPAEVDRVLSTHPAIVDAAAYGVQHPLLGEEVWADVVYRPGWGVSEAEIRAHCREQLAEAKVPAVLNVVAEIPKGPTGKILKRLLRERALADLHSASRKQRHVSRGEAERWITAWVAVNLPFVEDGHGAAFAELGMDSITAVRLAKELSDWLGRRVDVTVAWSFPTAQALARHLAAQPRQDIRRLDSVEHLTNSVEHLTNDAAEAALLNELELLNR